MTERDYSPEDRLIDCERALEWERERNERFSKALNLIADGVYRPRLIASEALWTSSKCEGPHDDDSF